MRQLSKIFESRFIKVDAALGLVGETKLDQPFYLDDDLRDVLRGAGIVVDIRDAQGLHILQISLLELAGERPRRDASLCSSLYDLIVYIGYVLQVEDAEAFVLEISRHHIKGDVGSGMTYM